MTRPSSLVAMLSGRADRDPDRAALAFVDHLGAEHDRRTYRDLDRRARAIAAALQERRASGPCLLLYPPGLEFVAAFFGCLYAGLPAVPVFPPDPSKPQQLRRLLAVADEADPVVALTTQAILPVVKAACEALSGRFAALTWLGTDGLSDELHERWSPIDVRGSDLAFLQYTSGSTSAPRGAMVTHENLLDNLGLIASTGRYHRESRCVSWLPPYHDMGLIGCILEPIYAGFLSVLMSPGTFLRRPHVWLKVLSDVRGTASAAPNFAFDLCARKVTEEQRAGLDLGAWDIAYCGAEPVRAATLERFIAAFAPCGFRPGTLYPCYGLAEATLIVTGGEKGEGPVASSFSAAHLERGEAVPAPAAPAGPEQARALISCGRPLDGIDLRIVDPVRGVELGPGKVGEIWLRGPSVVQGYWRQPEASAATFEGYLEGDREAGPFLRTGDMGFRHGGSLFVSGRIKDLIIVNGRNLFAEDVEHTVDRATPAIRRGGCVAFGYELEGEEALVIVAELERDAATRDAAEGGSRDLDGAAREISARVFDEHRVAPGAVVLVGRGSLPRTSSGKLQRFQTRRSYAEREFRELFVHAPARRTVR